MVRMFLSETARMVLTAPPAALAAATAVGGPAYVYREACAPRELSTETLFLQMLEAASRRQHA